MSGIVSNLPRVWARSSVPFDWHLKVTYIGRENFPTFPWKVQMVTSRATGLVLCFHRRSYVTFANKTKPEKQCMDKYFHE